MPSRTKLPHSVRKFLRREKARIRKSTGDEAEAERKIHELVTRIRAS